MADSIILEKEEFNRRIAEAEAELLAIEAQIADAEPDGGAYAAAEILRVVLDLVEDSTAHDGRDAALLRKALAVMTWGRTGTGESGRLTLTATASTEPRPHPSAGAALLQFATV